LPDYPSLASDPAQASNECACPASNPKSVSENWRFVATGVDSLAMATQTKRNPYPSDLSDAEWQQIEPHLPKRKSPRGRKREHSLREIVSAIYYVLRSGCAWRMMPHDLPPWKTVYHYFRLWRKDGVWAEINAILRTEWRVASGRDPQPSAAILDSQSVKTTEKGGLVATTQASALMVGNGTFLSTRKARS